MLANARCRNILHQIGKSLAESIWCEFVENTHCWSEEEKKHVREWAEKQGMTVNVPEEYNFHDGYYCAADLRFRAPVDPDERSIFSALWCGHPVGFAIVNNAEALRADFEQRGFATALVGQALVVSCEPQTIHLT